MFATFLLVIYAVMLNRKIRFIEVKLNNDLKTHLFPPVTPYLEEVQKDDEKLTKEHSSRLS